MDIYDYNFYLLHEVKFNEKKQLILMMLLRPRSTTYKRFLHIFRKLKTYSNRLVLSRPSYLFDGLANEPIDSKLNNSVQFN